MAETLQIYSVFDDCYVGKLSYAHRRIDTDDADKKKKKNGDKPIETIVILDISGSMCSNVERLAERVLPQALRQIGYPDEHPITLITFETQATLHRTTVGEIARLGLQSMCSTYMSNAVKILGQVVAEISDEAVPIRLLTLSDGELDDQAQTVEMACQLAPLFARRAVNSQAIRYFTSQLEPDTRGLASVLQFSTVDVKDSLRSGLIDAPSATTNDDDLAALIAGLFRDDGVDCDAYLETTDDDGGGGIQLVPWAGDDGSTLSLKKVRLAYGDNIFWFKTPPPQNSFKVNGESILVENCGPLTCENFRQVVDAKLQSLAFKIKSLQVVNSTAAQQEIDAAKRFFHRFFGSLDATLPSNESSAGEYRKRLAFFKDKIRRRLKGQSNQFSHIFNAKRQQVHVLTSAEQANYMQQNSYLSNARFMQQQKRSKATNCFNYQQQQQQQQIDVSNNDNSGFFQRVLQSVPFFGHRRQQLPSPPPLPFNLQISASNISPRIVVQQQEIELLPNWDVIKEQPDQNEELDEIDMTLLLHDEVKAMKEHLSELDNVDDSQHVVSFFSYATTLAGIRAVCELYEDAELFETMDAMELLQLINIVGVACNGPIGSFENPSHWQVDTIFPGCYVSISDLVVASKQSGPDQRSYLNVPLMPNKKITSVIPLFEDDRVQTFLQNYAPNMLEFCCSIGMRNKVTSVRQTYWQTMASGIWKLAQEIANGNRLQVTIDTFSRLVKSYKLAIGEDSFGEIRQCLTKPASVSDDTKWSFYLAYNGVQRLVGPLIQTTRSKQGGLKATLGVDVVQRILRALFAHETYLALRIAGRLKADDKPIAAIEGDDIIYGDLNKIISHCDCIAVLPLLIEMALNDDDNGGKIKALPPLLDEAAIYEAFGLVNYESLKQFKIYNILQAFAFDKKEKRWNLAEKRMNIVDLGDQKTAQETIIIHP